jgi:hypothetical protein
LLVGSLWLFDLGSFCFFALPGLVPWSAWLCQGLDGFAKRSARLFGWARLQLFVLVELCQTCRLAAWASLLCRFWHLADCPAFSLCRPGLAPRWTLACAGLHWLDQLCRA